MCCLKMHSGIDFNYDVHRDTSACCAQLHSKHEAVEMCNTIRSYSFFSISKTIADTATKHLGCGLPLFVVQFHYLTF